MNQNIFCSKCHRIPSQCCCSSAKELTEMEITQHQCEAEIEEKTKEVYTKNLTEMYKRQLDFTKELVKKASEK